MIAYGALYQRTNLAHAFRLGIFRCSNRLDAGKKIHSDLDADVVHALVRPSEPGVGVGKSWSVLFSVFDQLEDPMVSMQPPIVHVT